MKFCPDCNVKLSLIPVKRNSKAHSIEYRCSNCGYSTRNPPQTVEPPTTVTDPVQETIVVIGEDTRQLRTLPTTRRKCPQCANNVAYFWQVQTRSADEGSTQFYRCTKCNQTWRLYT